MKKNTIIQIIVIIVLAVILGVLVKFTIDAINENNMPQISTANVIVNDATLVAKTSEGIVIEGKNSVTINNCNLTVTLILNNQKAVGNIVIDSISKLNM